MAKHNGEKKKRKLEEEERAQTTGKEELEEEEEEEEDNSTPTKPSSSTSTPIKPEKEPKKKKKKNKKKKENLQVKSKYFSVKPNNLAPFVGYFPSGYDPVKKSQPEEDRVKAYRNVKRTNRMHLAVTPAGCSLVDFVGTNYSGEAATGQMCVYTLGVLDKEAKTFNIYPIAANKILRLEPKIRGSEQVETTPSEAIQQEFTAEEKADKMRELTLMYSSKKTVRQAKKRDSLRQNQDPETQQDLNRKIEEIKINKDALEVAASTTNARNIPPHDLAATTPYTAYPLDKIIYKGEWSYLLDILELSQGGKEVAQDAYPSFVCNRIYKLEDIKDDMEKKKLAGILSYITHLVKFKDKHSMDGFASGKHHKIPRVLFEKFSMMFGVTDSHRLPDEKRDLLVSYVLVLSLYADDFRTDPSDIAKDLRMNAIALRPHFEYLGCKLVREKQMLLATLPVPLQFPSLRRKRRR